MLTLRDWDLTHDDGKFRDDSESHGADLPEDLVEKVVARMSFPQILKARLLSKHWYSKFPKIELRGSQQSPFLNEIRSVASHQWPTYCPTFISLDKKSGSAFIHGFDRSTESWEKFRVPKTIPYLSDEIFKKGTALRGAILVFDVFGIQGELIVANVVTGTWRILPSCSLARIFNVWVNSNASGAYEVLVCGQQHSFEHCLYSSESSSWSTCSRMEFTNRPCEFAYAEGYLYELSRTHDHWTLVRRNWESGVEVAVHVPYRRHENILKQDVFQCASKVLVLTVFRKRPNVTVGLVNSSVADIRARVYEVPLQDPLKVTVVSESPARVVPRKVVSVFSGASGFIYLCGVDSENMPQPLCSYSVSDQLWCLHSAPEECGWPFFDRWKSFSSFEPGLNPFAVV